MGDTRSLARVSPQSRARIFLFRSLYRSLCRTVSLFLSRIVLLFLRNPVSLFLDRAVPLSLYRHPQRWPSRCVVGEDTMDNVETSLVFILTCYIPAAVQINIYIIS